MADVITYPHFEPHFPRKMWVLPKILEKHAAERGGKPFLQWTDEGRALSYDEVNRLVNRMARGLRALGVRHGDRVIIYKPNSLDYVLSWFAISKLGAAHVTIGEPQKGAFLEHQVNLSGARLMIAGTGLLDRVAEIEADIPKLEHVVIWTDPESPAASPAFKRLRTSRYEELAASSDESNLGVEISEKDLGAVLYTSGTTGPTKAVSMPHSQFYFSAEENCQLVSLKEDDVYITAFPFFHGNAQFLTIYPTLIVGAKVVMYRKFSASDWLGRVRRSGCTVLNLLGATMAFILAQPASADDKNHKLTRIWGAPTPPILSKDFAARFGVSDFREGFGQTEVSLPLMTPPGQKAPGSCGVAVSQYFDVRLVDPETDEDVPAGVVGELILRHKQPGIICAGYLGMPEKTVDSWRDLWFRTGDGLKRDEQGWFYFIDRMKDTLRRRGENISSYEVEAVILRHPSVDDCGVVAGKSDEEGGEDEVLACVVVKPGESLTPEELMEWCEARMPYFAVPRFVRFMEVLPKTPSEKVQKIKLRNEGVTADTWDRVKAGFKLKEEGRKR